MLQDSTFSTFSKDQNENQNFEKHLNQKTCYIRRLNVTNYQVLDRKIAKKYEKR